MCASTPIGRLPGGAVGLDLVNVQLLVRKVGKYLFFIVPTFVRFENGTFCELASQRIFNSFSSQLRLIFVHCHAVCVAA